MLYLVSRFLYYYNVFIFMCRHGLLKTPKIRKMRISVQEINFYQSIQQRPFFPQCLICEFKHDSSPPQFHPRNNNLSEKCQILYPKQSDILSKFSPGDAFLAFLVGIISKISLRVGPNHGGSSYFSKLDS